LIRTPAAVTVDADRDTHDSDEQDDDAGRREHSLEAVGESYASGREPERGHTEHQDAGDDEREHDDRRSGEHDDPIRSVEVEPNSVRHDPSHSSSSITRGAQKANVS